MPETPLNERLPIPSDGVLDSTLAFLRDGYLFVSKRCDRLDSDLFSTRLMLRRAVCMRGAVAAELFYGSDRFTRVGAMPVTVVRLLQDYGSVQTLDGAQHRHRKRMFMSLVKPEAVARLAELTEAEWLRRLPDWARAPKIVLFDEVRAILAQAVCAWAGVPLEGAETARRTRELSEMIESAGSVGPRNWRAQILRARSERWARDLVRRARAGTLPLGEDAPLRVIATHLDHDGRLLDVKVAAVELLNVLRPTVAVARFMVFAALVLHRHPDVRQRVLNEGEPYLEAFAQEVRRQAPFFPIIGGRVKEPFDWRGHRFAQGDWVILDLYGTNHDPRSWRAPEAFRPERLLERRPSPFDLIPQGGGEHLQGHRCPGEGIAIELTKLATRMLTGRMRYDVPAQDLLIDLARVPALPESGFVIKQVAATPARARAGDENKGEST
ncbi:cytochrome P450 [Paracoccus sp. 22332]|uniref:cytochrome P450 n=1 Tax=Paracoccus sp. 22332 TaxID=3453913 RepID=UPI003F86C3D0